MDPIGLALENFDGLGRWRAEDSGSKIDASGQLVDGARWTELNRLTNEELNEEQECT